MLDTIIERLYLLQLSTSTVPVAPDRTIAMVSGAYLIATSDGKHILIDTGMTPDAAVQGLPPAANEKNVLAHLADLGLQPGDISTVICTHFDVDHAGFHDAFPQAEFIVQRTHYDVARSGHPRYALARAHWDAPGLHYRLVDGDTEILPGLILIETSGHAPGHQSVLVRLPQMGAVLLAIDAVILQSLFTPDRRATPIDDNEEQVRASARKLIALAKSEHAALVVFGHDGQQWQTLKRAPYYYE
jgi:N-acyl homoserine lactone hydrolase